jgi:hypothetical protein
MDFLYFFGSVKFASASSPLFLLPGAVSPPVDVATPSRCVMLSSHRVKMSSLPPFHLLAMLHPIASPLERKPKGTTAAAAWEGSNETKSCQRWSGCIELVLAAWEGSATWHDIVATLVGGEAIPERGKGGENASWAEANLTGVKNKENSRGWFSCYKWTMKI